MRDYQALIVDEVPDALIATAPNGLVQFWSRGATTLFGYAAEDAIGKSLADLTVPVDRWEDELALLKEAEHAVASSDALRRRRDGVLLYVSVTLRALRGRDGEIECFVRSETDITRLRLLRESRLLDARYGHLLKSVPDAILIVNDTGHLLLVNARAETIFGYRRDELIGQPVEILLPERYRTPLNAIIGFTGTLLMQLPGPLTTDQDKQLRTVQSSARHLLSLINDLLDLAKIESGKVQLDLQPLVLAEVVQEVCAALQPAAERKGLRLSTHLPAEEIRLCTDRRSLSQILINLANNAIKFTERGEIRLEARRAAHDGRAGAQIDVVDTGIGIRPEDHGGLFEAFGRIAVGSSKTTEGTGLGLHLSQKLAYLLGGTIALESTPGRGSRFTLSLPDQPQ